MDNKEMKLKVLEHWNDILSKVIGIKKGINYDKHIHVNFKIGINHCAYCKEYFNNGCTDCPVSLKAGRRKCYDTPYVKVLRSLNDFKVIVTTPVSVMTKNIVLNQLIFCVKKQIEFLETT